jgi:polyisoprenoid-binding protein YceI
MSGTLQVRTLDGVEIPEAGTWEIDGAHSLVGFTVRHLMIAKVRGAFTRFSGSIEIGEDALASSVDVRIDAASIDTNEQGRDEHLRSPDFFDVEKHPEWRFVATGVRKTGARTFDLDGTLTIRDVTRPVTLHAEYNGVAADPWGGRRAAFTASTEIDREEFGLTWNQALEAGGVLVGKVVKIQLEIEAVKQG